MPESTYISPEMRAYMEDIFRGARNQSGAAASLIEAIPRYLYEQKDLRLAADGFEKARDWLRAAEELVKRLANELNYYRHRSDYARLKEAFQYLRERKGWVARMNVDDVDLTHYDAKVAKAVYFSRIDKRYGMVADGTGENIILAGRMTVSWLTPGMKVETLIDVQDALQMVGLDMVMPDSEAHAIQVIGHLEVESRDKKATA